MSKLFPTYEVGSLPKLNARVKATRNQEVTNYEINRVKSLAKQVGVDYGETVQILEKAQAGISLEEKSLLADFNALLYLRLQESLGFDHVYDGEARRKEMYQHVANRVDGFEKTPEMIRSRGPDSWRMAVCVSEPRLKDDSLDGLVIEEFDFVLQHAVQTVKVPIDDPYMIAVMSDNRYYLESLNPQYGNDPHKLRYEAKRAFTLALASNVIRPQVEAVVERGAKWE